MSETAVDPTAIFDSVLLPGIAERTLSADDIEAAGGLPAAETLALVAAFGLSVPGPGQPAFSPEEARAYVELQRLRGVWPEELALQLSRVYGRQISRIAQASVQLFRLYVERRLRSEAGAAEPAIGAVQAAFADLLPLTDPFLVGVHRRWIEHALAQAAVTDAEHEAVAPLPGAVDVGLLFCDLKGFTAYTDAEGDAAAVTAIDRFTETVVRERGHGFRLMKSLGDGVMLSYADAADAVAAGGRIVAGMPGDGMPGVHASVHRGVAIAREGDYFGGAVNLTARLLAKAGSGELLATGQAVAACDGRFAWQRVGARRLRGVSEPVEVFRLRAGHAVPGC
jgi:adenylate cyclase